MVTEIVFPVHLEISRLPVVQPRPQPVPRWLPGPQVRTGVDWEVNDPRYERDDEPYTSRTTKDTIPMAHKLEGGESQPMNFKWAKFQRDCLGLYVPAVWHVMAPDWNDGRDWSWIPDSFKPMVATELDKQYLHLIHGARALTNKTGPNNPGFLDPWTGFGTPNEDGTPPTRFYEKEPVTLGNNVCSQYSGREIWALDGFEDPPDVELVRDRFDILHICTQSTALRVDKTPGPNTPNGVWKIDGFPQAGDNIVVHPIISRWTNGKKKIEAGLHLRTINIPLERLCDYPAPDPRITWPLAYPNPPLIVNP